MTKFSVTTNIKMRITRIMTKEFKQKLLSPKVIILPQSILWIDIIINSKTPLVFIDSKIKSYNRIFWKILYFISTEAFWRAALDIPAELGHHSAKKTVELSKTLQNFLRTFWEKGFIKSQSNRLLFCDLFWSPESVQLSRTS